MNFVTGIPNIEILGGKRAPLTVPQQAHGPRLDQDGLCPGAPEAEPNDVARLCLNADCIIPKSRIPEVSVDMAEERVNVAVRLRPLSNGERSAVELQEDRSVALHDDNGTKCSSSYDAVFESSASNADVFQVVVRGMVDQALQGKNATIFAYGQTGSGKTHTIEGLMQQASEHIFGTIASTPDREFLLKLSAVEVYNEVVHDLLKPDSGRRELVEARPGHVVIKDLREESLASAAQLLRLLQSVREHRKVPALQLSAVTVAQLHASTRWRPAKGILGLCIKLAYTLHCSGEYVWHVLLLLCSLHRHAGPRDMPQCQQLSFASACDHHG